MHEAFFLEPIFIIVYIFLLFLTVKGYKNNARFAQLLTKTATTQIDHISQPGTYKVKGKVLRNDNMLLSPVSGKPCLHYSVLLQKETTRCEGRGKNRKCRTSWATEYESTEWSDFHLHDGSGKMGINPGNAMIIFRTDLDESTGIFSNNSEKTRAFLDQRKLKYGKIFNGKYRLKETFIEPNDDIYVFGPVVEIDGQLVFDNSQKKAQTFIISDKPETSIIRESRHAAMLFVLLFLLLLSPAVILLLINLPYIKVS